MTVPDELIRTCSKTNLEIMQRYLRNGIILVVDGYRPDEQLPPERLLELGFTHLRLHPELYLSQETANTMTTLRHMGFTLLGGNADSPDTLAWLLACGVYGASGTMTGVQVDEDELILDSLAREETGSQPITPETTSVEEAPVEEAPAEEAPVEEAPAEEEPVAEPEEA